MYSTKAYSNEYGPSVSRQNLCAGNCRNTVSAEKLPFFA